jgi:ADP-heptose:LPS heptosyltransferase
MAEEVFVAQLDCRYFIGEKPCKYKRLCKDCPHYDPMGTRILIIKLAAVGDVMRTTSLLPSLQKAHSRLHVTWLTDQSAQALLEASPGIDRLMAYCFENVQQLLTEEFDLAICLDKEPRATVLIQQISAKEKMGFGLSQWGTPMPLNPEAAYAYRLGLDDELKFHRNQLTYQQIIHEALGLEGPSQAYSFRLTSGAESFADEFYSSLGLDPAQTVGLNTGAGPVFAHKAWLPERFAALADWLREDLGLTPLLLGGPLERELNQYIAGLCHGPVADSQGKHDLVQFAALLGRLRLMVTSDSVAMHLGLAQKVPSLVLFGSTCPQEIQLSGPGRLLRAGLDCQPCYQRKCDLSEHCMKAISLEMVQQAVKDILAEAA